MNGWLGGARRNKPQELASVLYKTKLRGFMRPRRCERLLLRPW